MALLEAVRPFKYMGQELRPGDPLDPHPDSATLERQLVEHRYARLIPPAGESSEAARPGGAGRGRRRTPRPAAPPVDA